VLNFFIEKYIIKLYQVLNLNSRVYLIMHINDIAIQKQQFIIRQSNWWSFMSFLSLLQNLYERRICTHIQFILLFSAKKKWYEGNVFSVDIQVRHTILWSSMVLTNILLSVISDNYQCQDLVQYSISEKNYSQMGRMLSILLLIYVIKMIYILGLYE
jgi:hypothetical protein